MRSFTKRDGTTVEVTEEHLQTAVSLKKELQEASPARRCSWGVLVRLMKEEGFDDVENSENYRAMIKHYQKSIDELPSAAKHADMVATGKLEAIKNLVGDISYEKRENMHVLKELNQAKRQLIDFSLTAEQISNSFHGYDWTQFHYEVEPRENGSGKQLIVCLTDLHIGALVDTDINQFNFEVAKNRLKAYAEEVIAVATHHGVTDIHVVNLGDVVEHSNMRYGQAFHSEFTFSEQIVRASDAIIKFLVALAIKGFKLSYAGFAGNHDRITDKDKNIDGDHAVKPINYAIQTFIDNADMGQIEYIQAKNYSHRLLDINGVNFKFVHGDLDPLKDENLVSRHSTIDGVNYTAVVMGHYHHFRDSEVGLGKRILAFGSLKGADEYGEKIRKLSVASQGIILVDADGKLDVRRIELT